MNKEETSGDGPANADVAWPAQRRQILRDAAGIGIATGAYGLSFGAISSAAGLSVPQTCALSLLMFTGASQFALVGSIGSPPAAALVAVLLGLRNALYGLRLAPLLGVHGLRRLLAAQILLDESTAMSITRPTARAARLGFWATGLTIFVLWNVATLIGALGAHALKDPKALGLDAASPAAFLALLAPRMRTREPWVVALSAACVALVAVPFTPTGVPVLLAALIAGIVGLRLPRAQAPVASAPVDGSR